MFIDNTVTLIKTKKYNKAKLASIINSNRIGSPKTRRKHRNDFVYEIYDKCYFFKIVRLFHDNRALKYILVKRQLGTSSESKCDKNGYILEYINSTGFWEKYTRDETGNLLSYKNSDGRDYISLNRDYSYFLYYGLNDQLYHCGCQSLNKEDALTYCKKKIDNPGNYTKKQVNRAKAFYDIILNHNP